MPKAFMIDIETLDTASTAVILSIGAVIFDPKGGYISPQKFYAVVDLESQLNKRTISASALKFWMTKELDEERQNIFSSINSTLGKVLNSLDRWMYNFRLANDLKDTPVWSHGPSFDIAILEDAYKSVRFPIPWAYNAPRDTRTIFELAEFDFKNYPREGKFHNALDDALHQARCVQLAWNKIKTASWIEDLPTDANMEPK